MNELLQHKIERGRWLLENVRHAAMATVNEDGSPHNTPYFFMRDDELQHLYWGSHPEARHSKNVARTGKIFVVLYEASVGGGLYIRATDAHLAEGDELTEALVMHNKCRATVGKDPLPRQYYEGDSPQRMYKATIENFSVNMAERGEDGHIVRDYRHEITREDLL